MKKTIVVLTLIGILSFSSCKKEKDFDGSRINVESFLGSEVVEAMDDIGLTLFYGEKPPQIEGSFLINPAELKSSTVPADPETHTFDDLVASFKNQNNKDLTLDYEGDEFYENSVGQGTFIAGDGDNFTVYMKTKTTTILGGEALTAFIISGKMSSEGIVDTEVAVFMIEIIKDDIIVPFIPENTGRLIIDGNYLSDRI